MIQVVQRPPIFTVTPQRLYMRKLGETLEIPCDARDGDQSQRPAIVWFKASYKFRIKKPINGAESSKTQVK